MYVYLLRSLSSPEQVYIGLTENLKRRFSEHNAGKSFHTDKYRPWKISFAMWFEDEGKAARFERYLKSGSGCAFRAKHF
jgi:predicted GIY-YIG superfamily endonuclease